MIPTLSVAVGVIQNSQHEVLLAQRPEGSHQAGKWEFPGGKVDAHEIPRQALARELDEEIGIKVTRAVPLIRIHHDYGDKIVVLDVWRVRDYEGKAHGREGQPVQWVPIAALGEFEFPAANHAIINALRLPTNYVILPSELRDEKLFAYAQQVLIKGFRLLRFRAVHWDEKDYLSALPRLLTLCDQYHAQLIIDGKPEWLARFPAAGLHLTSTQLATYEERPIPLNKWLGVSCHNEQELLHAQKIGADYALLSPVLPTTSHPEARAIGWPVFSHLANTVNFPIYALGGMTLTEPAIWLGAHGVAGIRLFA